MRFETDDFAAPAQASPQVATDLAVAPPDRKLVDRHRRGTTALPIRSELFSVERLEEHARSLAAAQAVTPGEVKGASLAQRLADNEAVLAGRLPRCRRGHRCGRGHHPRGRVADRQFPCGGEADPRGPGRSAARLLSATAQARRRTLRGVSARVRRGLGVRGPYRQPLRPGGRCAATCAPIRRCSR